MSSLKLIRLARRLGEQSEFRLWLSPIGDPRNNGATSAQQISEPALRCVALSLLTVTWSEARSQGKFDGDDLILEGLYLSDLDQLAGAPGLGKAMETVGWAVQMKNPTCVKLPNFKEFNAPMTPAERMKKMRSGREDDRDDRATNAQHGAQPEKEKEKETKRKRSQETPESHSSPVFDFSSACAPIAERLYEVTGCTKPNDPFLWQIAVLVNEGAITELAIKESIESVGLCATGERVPYLRVCLERHVGGKPKLKEMLARVRLTRAFPRSPPQPSEPWITPATKRPNP